MGWQRGDGRVTGWRRLATSPGAPRCERNVSGAAARGGSETFRYVTPGPIEQQKEQGRRHEVQGRLRGERRQQEVRRQEQQGRQREGNRKRARLGPLHEEIGAVVEKFEIAPKVLRTEEKKLSSSVMRRSSIIEFRCDRAV